MHGESYPRRPQRLKNLSDQDMVVYQWLRKTRLGHACEFFTGTIKSLISAARISKTTGLIFTKFRYVLMLYIRIHYLTYIPNFKEIRSIVHEICIIV